jgi:hypothetical protein
MENLTLGSATAARAVIAGVESAIFSRCSIMATGNFMVAALITVFFIRHILGD